jgi:hypothetical protein
MSDRVDPMSLPNRQAIVIWQLDDTVGCELVVHQWFGPLTSPRPFGLVRRVAVGPSAQA